MAATGGSGGGIVIPAKIKLENVQEELEKIARGIQSTTSRLSSIRRMDVDAVDAAAQRSAFKRAYDKAYKKALAAAKEAGLSDDEAEAAAKGEAQKAGSAAANKAKMSTTDKQVLGLAKEFSKVTKEAANKLVSFTKMGIGILEDLYKELKKSSPLLRTIEDLFNLAWTLFFMPIGNALAMEMLPAMTEMLEAVVGMWDKFEGKSLSEMLSIAIKEGVHILSTYFKDIGNALKDEGGIVGTIGNLLTHIGDFIEKDGEKVINFFLKLLEFLTGNLGKILYSVIQLMIASTASLAGIYAYLIGGKLLGRVAGVVAVAAVETSGNAILNDLGGMDLLNFAEGGHVSATSGGMTVKVAEAGEGEWLVPDSKMDILLHGSDTERSSVISSLGGNVDSSITPMSASSSDSIMSGVSSSGTGSVFNCTYYINGYTDQELRSIITDTVNELSNQTRLRSGF